MKIEQLSPTCVTITLTAQDLEDYGVTYESLDYLCPHTRRIIQNLLNEALSQTDFSPEGCQLLIEASPVGEDGCLLTFTALSAEEAPLGPCEPTVFLFSSFERLCEACHRVDLQHSHRLFQSSLYRYHGQYALLLQTLDGPNGAAEDLMGQYGEPVSCPLLCPAIEEHGHCILCEHAVDTLSQQFEG